MKKARKTKTKSKQISKELPRPPTQTDLSSKSERSRKKVNEGHLQPGDDQTDEISIRGDVPISVNINSNLPDSETNSVTDKTENLHLRKYHSIYTKGMERQVVRTQIPFVEGPLTRRKENQIIQTTNQKNGELSLLELTTLKKFDDFYKDRKNIDYEIYYYQNPRVDRNLYQVCITTKPEDNNNKNNCFNVPGIFDFNLISKEDLSYYLKFISFYKSSYAIGTGNIFLKGAHSFEEKSLLLLCECNYNIHLALRRILFPLIDIIGEDDAKFSNDDENIQKLESNDHMLYVNSALNDLIGSNIHEKEQWIRYVYERICDGILFSELQDLIELANKMKIEIPEFVIQETEKSLSFAKVIRRHLNEKNTIKEITKLLELSENYKVKTEEFLALEDIIRKADAWYTKVLDVEGAAIHYKTLQNLYNEGKNIPIYFDGDKFENIKQRYLLAHQWQNNFNLVPKHSKTRQNSNKVNLNERCNISDLEYLVEESERINFTSNEVVSLKTNYEKMLEIESRAMMTLEDELVPKTKELLIEFVSGLDSLRFASDLFDYLYSKVEFFDWQERRDACFATKSLKVKHLNNLIKFANQKSLNNLPDIKIFLQNYEKIEKWLDTMSNIFYSEEDEEMSEPEEDLLNKKEKEERIGKSQRISEGELKSLYLEGKKIENPPEEVEHLLSKCEEIFEFVEECKRIISQTAEDGHLKDFTNLTSVREQILKYNIKCDDFEAIDAQISLVQNWIENAEKFRNQFNLLETKWVFYFKTLISLEVRQEMIEMLETFVQQNEIFYENLCELILSVPQFARSSQVFSDLHAIKHNSDECMSDTTLTFSQLSEVQECIIRCYHLCVKRTYFTDLINEYRSLSWAKIASLKSKMSLSEADLMFKEASNFGFQTNEVEGLKDQIAKTKDWLKNAKKIFSSDKISYECLLQIIQAGTDLPLHTHEIEELISIQSSIQADLLQARNYIRNPVNYNEFALFTEKISKIGIEVNEFEVLKKMRLKADDWKNQAEKILSSRKLCELYFKQNAEDEAKFKRKEDFPEIEEGTATLNCTKQDLVLHSGQDSNIIISKKKNRDSDSEYEMEMLAATAKRQRVDSKNSNSSSEFVSLPSKGNKKIIIEREKLDGKEKRKQTDLNTITAPASIHPLPSMGSNVVSVNTILDKLNLKKFNNLSYEEKIKIISKTVILKPEDENERYCICRKGDDSVNYMLMCDNCKEWFHGKCLKIQKSTADKILQYTCIACSKRKDVYNNRLHYDFFNTKRVTYERLSELIAEGERMSIIFDELDSLKEIEQNSSNWKVKYTNLLHQINQTINFSDSLGKIITDQQEKSIMDLYMESEGLPVEVEHAINLIVILKHYDWFLDAHKCIDNKKFSEKINKKVLSSSDQIFNRDNQLIKTNEEMIYFDSVIEKGTKLLAKITENFNKFTTTFNMFKSNSDKKTLDLLKEIIPQLQENRTPDNIFDEITSYMNYVTTVRKMLSISSVNEETIKNVFDACKKYQFTTVFLERFKMIMESFKKDHLDYYRCFLFEEGPKKYQKVSGVLPKKKQNNV